MVKTTWVILKEPTLPGFVNLRTAHMVGFSSKKEAQQECNRLNERSRSTLYTISKATVCTQWNP